MLSLDRMKVILFGATGMVGQGALRECLLDPEVEQVLSIVRSASGQTDPKLREVVMDVAKIATIERELAGYDATLFCLGISSAGMSEADYRRITHDLAVDAAKTIAAASPKSTFVFVSGAGTDAQSRTMWARVKGETENAILELPFAASYMFRPAAIRPMHGIVSKTKSYRVFYALLRPLFPVWKAVAPSSLTTTEEVGRAMLRVAKQGADKRILENADIAALGR